MTWLFGLLGAALVGLAFAVPATQRSDDGGLRLEGLALGFAGLVFLSSAWLLKRRLRDTIVPFATFLMGVAAQLILTEPLWLQYVRVRPEELREPLHLVAAAVLLLEAVLLLWKAPREAIAPILAFLRRSSPGLWIVFSLAFLASAAHITKIWLHRDEPRYLAFLALQYGIAAAFFAMNLAALAWTVFSLPKELLNRGRTKVTSLLSVDLETPAAERRPLDRRWPWFLSAFVFAFTTFHSVVVFDRIPHIQDEVAFLFQARCYAMGRLELEPPPVPEAFGYYLLRSTPDRWYGAMNPGWPFLLTLGEWTGTTHLLNPLISALTILLFHAFLLRVLTRGAANVGTLLLATSPWFLLVGGSLMTQPLSQALAILAALSIRVVSTSWRALPALVAGLALGFLFLVRPLDALVLGALLGVALLKAMWPRFRFVVLLALLIGGLATSIWTFPINKHFTGSPTRFTISDYFDHLWYPGADDLGFGPDVGNPTPYRWVPLDPEPGHGLTDVLLNANQNLYSINFEFLGFAVGSLLLPILGLFHRRRTPFRILALIFSASLVLAYSTYWFSGGPDFGARYWYLLLVPLLLFSVDGLRWLMSRARSGDEFHGARLCAAVIILIVTTVLLFLPWRLVGKYPNYRSCHDDVRTLVAEGAIPERALVLIDVKDEVEFGPALLLNRFPFAESERIFARDLGVEVSKRLIAAFPDRPVVRLQGRSASGLSRTRVVEPRGSGREGG